MTCLIYCETEYGSEEGNKLVDKVFETIATTAYKTSVELSKRKRKFPIPNRVKHLKKQIDLRNAFIKTGFMKKMPEDIRNRF